MPRPDLSALQIDSAIVHDVPARRVHADSGAPVFSEIDSELTQELRIYFREKIGTSLGHAAFEVGFDPGATSPVPRLVTSLFDGTAPDIVQPSKDMARHLYDSQTGVNPPGLLTAIKGSLEGRGALAILKLEREDGVRVLQGERNGLPTFDIQAIHDLMLTQKTKVFKVGLFLQPAKERDPIEGLVSDKQRGYVPTSEVADFFLRRFLGCVLRLAPEVMTRRLFDAAEKFINESVQPPEKKAKYQLALMAELGSQDAEFRPRGFAERHLDVRHRQPFIDALTAEQVPDNVVRKDTKLVESHLRKLRMDFESGVLVVVPPGAVGEQVEVEELDDGRTHVDIKDKLRAIGGKR